MPTISIKFSYVNILWTGKFQRNFGMLVIIAFSLLGCGSPVSTQSPAKVWISEDTIHYEGDISSESWEIFEEAIAYINIGNLRRIVIDSGGGDTQVGRQLGTWVFEKNLDVEVEGGCFSSCANYVFVAGRNKTIREGAFVGWHGDERQAELLKSPDEDVLDYLRKEFRSAMLEHQSDLAGTAQLEQDINYAVESAMESLHEEHAFYQRLGLEDIFAIYGLLPENIDSYYASGKGGWTFSVNDMGRLGIQNVSYLGNTPYETSSQVLEYVKLFELQ